MARGEASGHIGEKGNPPGKIRITIRIDEDVLDWFREQVHRAGGGNYQTLINNVLVDYIRVQKESLEATLRRVLREEMPAYVVRKGATRRKGRRSR